MFDLDGKFVRKIGRQGRGPGEFQSIANIAVDHSDQTFVILCSHPHKMIRFTVDGKYIEEIQLEIFASSIVFDNDRIYLYTNSNKTKKDTDYQLYTTNIKGKIKDSFLPFGSIKQYPHPVIINNSQAFVKNHDEILFYMPLEETIFSLRNNKLTEKYKLDFGENSIPYSYIDKNSTNPDFMFQLSSEKYAMNLHHVFETNQHLFFNITINQLLYRLAYHKTAHTLHHFRDDVTELHPVLFSLTQQEMLGAKTAMAIIIENRYKTLKNQKTKFEALASSLQETSNPVIVRYWNE